MTYQVELSIRAQTDIREAYDYIREHGPASPDAWKAGLDRKLTSLETFPESCSLALENELVPDEVRQTFYGPFRILFTIRGSKIYVITVRHGARRTMRADEIGFPEDDD